MRNVHYVKFVTYNEIPISYKYKWWDRIRWGLVKLLGGENPRDTVKVVRVQIQSEEFVENIFKQKSYLVERFNMHPDELLIGAEDYEEIMGCKNITQMFSFNASYYDRRIYGLKVIVVPWMRGILVMPRKEDKNNA